MYLFVCYYFTSHSRILHSYGDVTICRWRASNFGLYLALMAIEQWGFFNVPTSTATRDLEFYCLIRRTGNRPVQPARLELATSWSKVERATDWATGPALGALLFLYLCFIYVYIYIWIYFQGLKHWVSMVYKSLNNF